MPNYDKEAEEKCYGFRRKTVRIFPRDFNERKKRIINFQFSDHQQATLRIILRALTLVRCFHAALFF